MITEALSIISEANILTSETFNIVSNLSKELSKSWATAQAFRTPTEMRVSVLQDLKHPTPDSKYWQAVREQSGMFKELVFLSYEYRKNDVEIKILKRDIENSEDELNSELLQIEVERKQFISLNMKKQACARINEITEWSKIKSELESKLQYGTDNVDAHQLSSYKRRFENEVNLLNASSQVSEKINVIGKHLTVKRM